MRHPPPPLSQPHLNIWSSLNQVVWFFTRLREAVEMSKMSCCSSCWVAEPLARAACGEGGACVCVVCGAGEGAQRRQHPHITASVAAAQRRHTAGSSSDAGACMCKLHAKIVHLLLLLLLLCWDVCKAVGPL